MKHLIHQIRMMATAVIASTIFVGCQLTFPPPEISSIEPVWGYNGEETLINIYGDNFYPHVEVDSSADEVFVDRTFKVWLFGPIEGEAATYALPSVILSDYHHLRGMVIEGLTPGTYDVIVEGPLGDQGQMDGAFVVTDTRIDHVRPVSETLVYEVYETAWVEFFLEDPEDVRMFEPLDVTISVATNGVITPVVFDSLQLENAQPLADGGTILGSLDAEGYARLGITLSEPQMVEISVSATDAQSVVGTRTIQLLWEPGAAVSLDVLLPDNSGDFEVVAGEEFPVRLEVRDAWGNLVDTTSHAVVLVDACQTLLLDTEVTGTATVDVTFTGVTGNQDCKIQQIESLFGPPGASATMSVVPGPTAAFDVRVPAGNVVAGEWLNAFIDPIDAYGNITLWSVSEIETLVLQDSVKGIVEAQCFGDISSIFCRVRPTISSEEVTLKVTDSLEKIQGVSNIYTVNPADVASLEVTTLASVVAGDAFPVDVHVLDIYGNAGVASSVADSLEYGDSLAEVSCVKGTVVDDIVTANCTLTTAVPSNVIDVAVSGGSSAVLPASSASIEIVNGAISAVQISPVVATVIAGDLLQVTFLGVDAYGNSYVQQTDAVIDLQDSFGTVSPNSVTLGSSGGVTSDLIFTQAGSVTLTVEQSGTFLGESSIIEVVSAEAVSLEVTLQAPWIIVGEPVEAVLIARDTWGNHNLQFEEGVDVFPLSGLGPLVSSTFVGGVATVEQTWTSSPIEDQLTATSDSGLFGQSATVVVGADCGASNPQFSVGYGGLEYGVACFDGEMASTAVLHSVSDSGSAPVALYALSVDGDEATVDIVETLVARAYTTGRSHVASLVVNEDGCATVESSDFFVAYDDGSVAGMVPITPIASSYVVGVDQAELSIGPGLDCAGDIAENAGVYLRSTRGTPLGGVESSTGLAYDLDSDGNASVLVDHSGEVMGGIADLLLWTDSGAGAGAVSWEVTGDDMRPTVWSISPVGLVVDDVTSVLITFSERIYYANIGHYGLSGPSGVFIDTVSLVDGGYGVSMTLSGVIDPFLGTHTGFANNLIRDIAGNRLDGGYNGVASDFLWSFGTTPSVAPDILSCTVDQVTIHPDGDDGLGVEQDTVTVEMSADSTPTMWLLSVETESGELIQRTRFGAVDMFDQWVWDARGVGGAIVDNGFYELIVEAVDEYGNVGDSCSAFVAVDNAGGE
jgi:hypothetical protein